MLREATLEDVPEAVQLFAVVNPEFVNSVEGLRHNWEASPPEAHRGMWLVEHDDEVVGWASTAVMIETSEPGVGWMGIGVHPEHRRAGFGAALLEAVERHARESGVRRLLAWSRGDEGSATFSRAHGYEQTGSDEILVIDPRDVEPPAPPPGIEIGPYAAFADDPRQIYAVDSISFLDEPGDARFDAVSYEYTGNDATNGPMLAINRKLGYRPHGIELSWRKLFVATSEP